MIQLPPDVVEWLTAIFRTSNESASSKLTLNPNAHEPWLDFAVIEKLQRVSVPFRFKSDWLVSIDTHWLGNAPLWPEDLRRWEVADIGFLVMMRTVTKLVRSKVALLQSKRLYALEAIPETEEEIMRYYRRGFGRMYQPDELFAEMTKPRLFRFDEDCKYLALAKGSHQWEIIEQYEQSKEIPVYYLFHNPSVVPLSVPVPHSDAEPIPKRSEVGCRVVPCRHVRQMMASASDNESPSYGQIVRNLPAPFGAPEHAGGWRLEHFVVELLLRCKTGRVTDIRNDRGLYEVFNRRSGPIPAAIAITIDAPSGFDWEVGPDVAG